MTTHSTAKAPHAFRADVVARTSARRAARTAALRQGIVPISDVTASNGDAPVTEFYVDWSSQPVAVAIGRAPTLQETWEVAGRELRQRVLAAIAPKAVHGWALDGTFITAVRWDRDSDRGRDLYCGCWVRLRRPES